MERVKPKRRTPELTPRLSLFGPPLLIEGEDAATYDELLAHMLAAVKPVDVIDEMWIVDVASLEWEVLRWRRLKTCLIRARGLAALEPFLCQNLDYDAYSDVFADHLTEILQENFPDNQAEDAQTLAHECAWNEPDAVRKVNKILDGANLDMDRILDNAKFRKAEELVQAYVRHESEAVALVDEHVAAAGTSMDTLLADCTRRETRRYRAGRSPNCRRRRPPQRQLARTRSASGGPRRNTATDRARGRGCRV